MTDTLTYGEKLPRVRLQVDTGGHGTLFVNDIELTNLTMGIDVSARAGSLTEVSIHLKPCNLTVEGDGALAFIRETAFPDTWNALDAAKNAREMLDFWERSPVLHDDETMGMAKALAEDVLAALGERR